MKEEEIKFKCPYCGKLTIYASGSFICPDCELDYDAEKVKKATEAGGTKSEKEKSL